LSQRIQILAQILSDTFVGQKTRLQTKVLREYLDVVNVHSAEVKALFEEGQHGLQILKGNKFVFRSLYKY
jgi:phosphatidylinositol kinase/protein kinase (PI-3  family)